MGWLSDAFLGSKPKYELAPGMAETIAELQQMRFGIGGPARQARKGYRRLMSGEDISNTGYFSPFKQAEAADLSDIEFDYSVGSNVLNAAGSGEQANQINAMRDRAKERRREDTGRQMAVALPQFQRDLLNTWQQGVARSDAMNTWQQDALMRARGNVVDTRRQGGILPGLISGGLSAGLGALTGGASLARGMGGGGSILPRGRSSVSSIIGAAPPLRVPYR